MTSHAWQVLGTALLVSGVGLPQTRPAGIHDRFENVDFGSGAVGEMPPGWHLGPEATQFYTAQIAGSEDCNGGQRCATVRSAVIGSYDTGFASFLYQNVDAAPYRGKRFTFRADVRAKVSGVSVARLLVRIHREDGSTSFRDDMGIRPIGPGPWATYEISAPIAADARDIELGLRLVGGGAASIDNISLVFGNPQDPADDREVRALIRKFADLRNARDGTGVAALYYENGEWSNAVSLVRGREALARLWGSVSGIVGRMIESLDFLGGDVVMIRATTQSAEPIGRHHESFIAVKENRRWYLRAHHSID